ncbi:inorganic phosphate transporter [Flavobacterium sp.]|uniref:inorganic phosphate transporter n=1 Tax=Flavobacterium sp. TaxID=239 RepID=UPI003D2AE228
MEQIYVIMLVALAILASIDLMVGVANDAVNFLNSGIGSKAVSFKTLMIVASVGIALGALFSSGMMEIARSGIFTPSMFTFNDVMIIFLAVMVTDVLLLDLFNSLGLPTSTTVSIVFSLLGGAVCLGAYKLLSDTSATGSILQYINQKKATEIVTSILLSVLLSFSIGAFVQYISRILFSFEYEKKVKYFGAIFGGIGITAISFFILFKGLKSSTILSANIKDYMSTHQLLIIGVSFVFWTILSQIFISFKVNIFRIIIVIGTFALALAFAGNDLVNFIGVPIAALQSYEIYVANGSDSSMLMGALASSELKANFWLLLFGGGIMVYTIWTSKKAKDVIATGVDLSRQSEGTEKFDANNLSRVVVRGVMYIGQMINYVLPKSIQIKIDKRFEKPELKSRKADQAAFDMVRASVNLMVASILIAIGTSMKLPLSTTYVTFMVAMGTSFADRAWDRESAVFRVAGVINVIGGWFVTAFAAFLTAGLVTLFLQFGGVFAFFALMIAVAILMYRSSRNHIKKSKEKEEETLLNKEDIVTINEVINESSDQIASLINKSNKIYSGVISGLSLQDLLILKENKKAIKKLEKQVDDLKNNVYYFIKNLDETSVEGSKFYILILGYLQDISQSMSFIAQNGYSHVNNNHKQLKFNQTRDLKSVELQVLELFNNIVLVFNNKDFKNIDTILAEKNVTLDKISDLIQKQIERIRTTENSPKNSKLYFALLLETNDLIKATMSLLELFKDFNQYAANKVK